MGPGGEAACCVPALRAATWAPAPPALLAHRSLAVPRRPQLEQVKARAKAAREYADRAEAENKTRLRRTPAKQPPQPQPQSSQLPAVACADAAQATDAPGNAEHPKALQQQASAGSLAFSEWLGSNPGSRATSPAGRGRDMLRTGGSSGPAPPQPTISERAEATEAAVAAAMDSFGPPSAEASSVANLRLGDEPSIAAGPAEAGTEVGGAGAALAGGPPCEAAAQLLDDATARARLMGYSSARAHRLEQRGAEEEEVQQRLLELTLHPSVGMAPGRTLPAAAAAAAVAAAGDSVPKLPQATSVPKQYVKPAGLLDKAALARAATKVRTACLPARLQPCCAEIR